MHGQADEGIHSRCDLVEDFFERGSLFLIAAFHGGWIFETPMGGGGMSRPNRTCFAGSVVAYGNDEIHAGCIRSRELVPALAAQVVERVARFLHLFDGERVHFAARLAACAEALEAALAHRGGKGFCHDAARGIAGAEEQYVVGFFSHVFHWCWVVLAARAWCGLL